MGLEPSLLKRALPICYSQASRTALYGPFSFLTNRGIFPMKKFLLTGVALAALSGSALAADLPARRGMPVKAPEPVVYAYNWSGFYIGAHGGGGWSEKCFTFINSDDGCHNGDGFLGGGQIGFNYQANQFVFGVEFSGSWADISGDHAARLVPADTYRSEINSILMLTGRVGMTFDRMLLYVTGGGAWAHDKLEYVDAGVGTASAKKSRTGWTVGAWHRVRPGAELVDRRAIQLHRLRRQERHVLGRRRYELHRQGGSTGPPRDGAAQLPLRRRPRLWPATDHRRSA
jgi:outer membrane immunogenic protein